EGLADFAKSHLQLLRRIREYNPASVLLVGNVYHPQGPLPEELHSALRQANERIAKNILNVGGELIDIYSSFLGHEDEYLCLEIEPSLAGATAIANMFVAGASRRGVELEC
ncbi:MAG: hypothetical protein AAFQ65_15275, partial [Myxococcota bacterium]